jgi:hypothetical protein
MLCPHCGSESSDKARSCPSCRYEFAIETSSAAPPDTAAQEQQLKRLFRAAFVVLILGTVGWFASTRLATKRFQPQQSPALISQSAIPGRINVNAKSFMAYPFAVPAGCKEVKLEGSFETSAGMVELLVMDEKSFQGWKNHLPATALYSSGRLNHASVNLQLASTAGKYYFVVSNRASPRSAAVQSKLNLSYRIR